ncbi:MAG TPA: ABC transporter ATP-binding protein [Candidatus Limnocylindrales bacterium]
MTAATASPAATGHGVAVVFESMHRWYGPVHALDGLSIDIAPGELIALLGPSGCGKTTALRALGGLDEVDQGRILVGGKDITRVPANKRNMGIVFQAYSLFPNMTARDNVAYGLRLRGVDGTKRKRKADEMLDLVGLGAQATRYPHQMSGGQQQRVALARALAIEPSVLLLDEPLSALDAKVRRQLREEIRRIQIIIGITTLFVTHDQEEALAMGDRVGVMSDGRLEQIAPPAELYDRPQTRFVAEFVGLTNRIPGHTDGDVVEVVGARVPLLPGATDRGPVQALVRPENVHLVPADDGIGRVLAVSFLGSLCRAQVALPDETIVVAQMGASDSTGLIPGAPVDVSIVPAPVFAVAE